MQIVFKLCEFVQMGNESFNVLLCKRHLSVLEKKWRYATNTSHFVSVEFHESSLPRNPVAVHFLHFNCSFNFFLHNVYRHLIFIVYIPNLCYISLDSTYFSPFSVPNNASYDSVLLANQLCLLLFNHFPLDYLKHASFVQS